MSVCCICNQSFDGELSECLGCKQTFHSLCYGFFSKHNRLCQKCFFLRNKENLLTNFDADIFDPDRCELCPLGPDLPLKLTSTRRWAHVICALWVPEAFFQFPDAREPIDLTHVPARRFSFLCTLCKRRAGACLDCSEPRCAKKFHVTCALHSRLALFYHQNKKGRAVITSYCSKHTKQYYSGDSSSE